MTVTMTDRLMQKSYLVNMNGNSYKIKETKDWLDTLNSKLQILVRRF